MGAAQKVLAFRAWLSSACGVPLWVWGLCCKAEMPRGLALTRAQIAGWESGHTVLELEASSQVNFMLMSNGTALWSSLCPEPSLAPQHCRGK